MGRKKERMGEGREGRGGEEEEEEEKTNYSLKSSNEDISNMII